MVVQANQKMPWVFKVGPFDQEEEGGIAAGDSLTLRYTIHRVENGHQVMTGRREVVVGKESETPLIRWDDRAPGVEGVYEVRFELLQKQDKIWNRFRPQSKERVLQERRRSLLVLETRATPTDQRIPPESDLPKLSLPKTSSNSLVPWQTVGRIRPSGAAWAAAGAARAMGQWIPDSVTRLIPGVRRVSSDLQKGEVDGETVSILQPQSIFQATLPVMATGYPHHITVRCPRAKSGQLQVDIGNAEDPMAANHSAVISLDRSEQRLGESLDEEAWVSYTFLHYPAKGDQIWLTNLSESASVSFQSIEVSAGPSTAASLRHHRPVIASPSRRVVISVSDPHWVETMTTDWHPEGDAKDCHPEALTLHRTWIATQRMMEQAGQMGANTIALPMDNSATDSEGPQELSAHWKVVLKALRQHPLQLLVQVNQSLLETTQGFHSASAFAGLMVRLNSLPLTQKGLTQQDHANVFSPKFISAWKQAATGQRIFVETQDESMATALAQAIPDVIRVVAHDAADHRRTSKSSTAKKAPQPVMVRLTDSDWLRKNPSQSVLNAIEQVDPMGIILEHSSMGRVLNQSLQETCQVFVGFPSPASETLSPLDPSDHTARVQLSVFQNRVHLAITNWAPWDNSITWQLPPPDSDLAEDVLKGLLWERMGEDVDTSKASVDLNGGVVIPARGTLLLRSRSEVSSTLVMRLHQMQWAASVQGGEPVIAEIKKRVTQIVERIGYLNNPARYDQLKNGGFESVGEMGLVGWLHAQHPAGCVAVDTDEAIEGKHSIRLTTHSMTSGKTWLVSDLIAPPSSGRLAVSMALRAQQASDEETHQLRVSVEGTQRGDPVRYTEEVKVPRSGAWQTRHIVLEVAGIDRKVFESVRLTIDSLSSGRLWIDDVRLHDDFSTTRERTDLQNQAFLAVEGLQRGNLTPSARLLNNRWAQHLLSMPEPARKKTLGVSVETPLPESREIPEIADQNRGWFLDRLRF